MTDPVLTLSAVSKSYTANSGRIDVLGATDLRCHAGVITAVMGRSGSGKTTLLQIAGLLARPDSGSVVLDGTNAWSLADKHRAELRRERLGFVFQSFNLLPQHNAGDNVAMPFIGSRRAGKAKASQLLEEMGLASRRTNHPGQLSAGEQQRVAIARAVVNDPALVLADEPSGNLDSENELAVLNLLRRVADSGRSVLVVTHSPVVAAFADEVLVMDAGQLSEQPRNPTNTPPTIEVQA